MFGGRYNNSYVKTQLYIGAVEIPRYIDLFLERSFLSCVAKGGKAEKNNTKNCNDTFCYSRKPCGVRVFLRRSRSLSQSYKTSQMVLTSFLSVMVYVYGK